VGHEHNLTLFLFSTVQYTCLSFNIRTSLSHTHFHTNSLSHSPTTSSNRLHHPHAPLFFPFFLSHTQHKMIRQILLKTNTTTTAKKSTMFLSIPMHRLVRGRWKHHNRQIDGHIDR
jgi:hypothetical protein